MVCNQCQRSIDKLSETFTKQEKIFMLSSAISMYRIIESKGVAIDKQVANSVITKTMLSLPPEERIHYMHYFKNELHLEISIGDCPHGRGPALVL